jgi:phage-related protein
MEKRPEGVIVQPKSVRWAPGSKKELSAFPEEVRLRTGFALWQAQQGRKAPYARPLKGFGGAQVLEIADNFGGATFRVVYTVQLTEVVYVVNSLPITRPISTLLG